MSIDLCVHLPGATLDWKIQCADKVHGCFHCFVDIEVAKEVTRGLDRRQEDPLIIDIGLDMLANIGLAVVVGACDDQYRHIR